jgi:biotin operon repressor
MIDDKQLFRGSPRQAELYVKLDPLIISGRGSDAIASELGIRSTSVRRRRKELREAGFLSNRDVRNDQSNR